MNGPELECYITLKLERLARDKQSKLLGPLIIYDENKALQMQLQYPKIDIKATET